MSLYTRFLEDTFECDNYITLRTRLDTNPSSRGSVNSLYFKYDDLTKVYHDARLIPEDYDSDLFIFCSPIKIIIGFPDRSPITRIANKSPLIQHRWDGPAYIHYNGDNAWYFHGKFMDDNLRFWADENDIDLDNPTKDDINLIKLTWS